MTSIKRQGLLSQRRVAVVMAVCALVATSCANLEEGGTTAASPDASPTSAAPDAAVTSSSQPEASPTAVDQAFVHMAAAYVEEHPNIFAGVGWIGEDYSTFVVQVASGQEDTPEVVWLRGQVPHPARGGEQVEFITVTHSSSSLEHVIELLTPRQVDRHISGLGQDDEHNRVWVGASREQIEAAGGEERLLDLLYSDLPEEFQDVVLFLEEVEMATTEEMPPDDADAVGQRVGGDGVNTALDVPLNAPLSGHRRADTRPFNGGAGYRWQNDPLNPPRLCSLNVPIVIDGSRYMATAGHCRSNGRAYAETLSFNTESDMGKTFTSTWPGNTLQLGDWRLLRGRGGNYSPNIFRGGITGSETAPIAEATWSQPPFNEPLCSSGRTTGQVCRYRVVLRNTQQTFRNGRGDVATVGLLMALRHDSNLDGQFDCDGWRGGDSGGPIYRYLSSNPTDGVRTYGMVSASSWDENAHPPAPCPVEGEMYWATRLGGIRAWAPNAYIPST